MKSCNLCKAPECEERCVYGTTEGMIAMYCKKHKGLMLLAGHAEGDVVNVQALKTSEARRKMNKGGRRDFDDI